MATRAEIYGRAGRLDAAILATRVEVDRLIAERDEARAMASAELVAECNEFKTGWTISEGAHCAAHIDTDGAVPLRVFVMRQGSGEHVSYVAQVEVDRLRGGQVTRDSAKAAVSAAIHTYFTNTDDALGWGIEL